MKEISILEVDGVQIGHAQNLQAMTGCTVILCENGGVAGLEVRGGGPASRETELLKPLAAASRIHAVVLSGGSAFGLAAADGVMRYLYQKKIGFDAGAAKVPLVCASSIYDLQLGASDVWPDDAMGYQACQNAGGCEWRDGNVGAGVGATVGKLFGLKRMMKGGVGGFAVQLGDFQLGAVVVVNALGDIFDPVDGRQLAGLLDSDRTSFCSTEREFYRRWTTPDGWALQNTTLGVIVTNAVFTKTEMNKIASMASNGLARTIRPLNTSMDGDAIYAISTGNRVRANVDVAGTLAAYTVAMSVKRAVLSVEGIGGVLAARDLMSLDE